MKKLAAATIALVVLGVVLAAPVFAKGPYFKKPTCSVSDSTLSPGDDVTVSGKHWEKGTTVKIILKPEQILLGTATVADDKTFSITVTIPEDIRPGPHKIVCKGQNTRGHVRVKNTTITILGATVTPPAGTAFTGSTTNMPFWATLAGILALLGLTALFVARRLRRRPSTADPS